MNVNKLIQQLRPHRRQLPTAWARRAYDELTAAHCRTFASADRRRQALQKFVESVVGWKAQSEALMLLRFLALLDARKPAIQGVVASAAQLTSHMTDVEKFRLREAAGSLAEDALAGDWCVDVGNFIVTARKSQHTEIVALSGELDAVYKKAWELARG